MIIYYKNHSESKECFNLINHAIVPTTPPSYHATPVCSCRSDTYCEQPTSFTDRLCDRQN